MSVVEIYCERIRDLLSDSPEQGEGLAVQQDRIRGIVIPGACELPVRSEGEVMRIIRLGLARRMVAATGMNAVSSRSHCVVLLRLRQALEDGCMLHSKLCLVDLAGARVLAATRRAMLSKEAPEAECMQGRLGEAGPHPCRQPHAGRGQDDQQVPQRCQQCCVRANGWPLRAHPIPRLQAHPRAPGTPLGYTTGAMLIHIFLF